MQKPGLRISVDTGGTFTDVVVADADGRLTIGKASTTKDRIWTGLHAALESAAERLGLPVADLLSRAEVLIYGTTHATNAIVTGRTARTALLVTKGFRDVLVIKEGGKADPHNFSQPYPEPYVPRRHTFEIDERIDAEGGVIRALDEAEVRRVLASLAERDFQAVAVCLLWSIANPTHEQRLGELIESTLPGVAYTLSHRLNPILREYRRASSTAIDASIKPLMQAHLRELDADLRAAGFAGELLVSTTMAGCMDVRSVAERPIHTVRSGPAMAPVAGAAYTKLESVGDTAIVVDTGGTTFDVALVRDGRIVTTQETWIGPRWTGHVLGLPAVDVRSVGAGGGSIAWIDDGGLLRVGPQSAGAQPGPACYGAGGVDATVTDAALVLGYLDPDWFLGGRMKLDVDAARRAIARVAEPLSLALEAAAFSILSLANERMILAIKDITISEGVDPTEGVLVAGGGAAGLGIVPIARELGCRTVLVPRTAGALSACGMQFADLVSEHTASEPVRSRDFAADSANAALDAIDVELERFAAPLEARGYGDRTISYTVSAHYASQVWELEVPLPMRRFAAPRDAEQLARAFHDMHERVFAVRDEQSEIEFLSWTGRVTLRLPRATSKLDPGRAVAPPERPTRMAWFSERERHAARIVRGSDVAVGERIVGPAILEEETSTLVLPPGASATLSPFGTYIVEIGS